jgi:GTP-binding protein
VRNRPADLNVNIVKGKKLTNMLSFTSDQTVILRSAWPMSLDQCIAFIAEDELAEVTPESIRFVFALLQNIC